MIVKKELWLIVLYEVRTQRDQFNMQQERFKVDINNFQTRRTIKQ